MQNKASMTALMSAFARAYHTMTSENPVFSDSAAIKLFSDCEIEMMCRFILAGLHFFDSENANSFENNEQALKYAIETQLLPLSIARSVFCEESLKTAALTGTVQYVILGAGYDTFAFRETELMKKLEVFEIDCPAAQQDKLKRIKRAGFEIPQKLHFVPCDFTDSSFCEKLISCGFDKNKKTFFSLRGISYYLSKEEIEGFLKNLSIIAADGSSLLLDFADSGLFFSKSPRIKNMLAVSQASGYMIKSGFDELSMDTILSDYGFMIYELLNANDIQSRFFSERDDCLSSFEHINYILSVYKERKQRCYL